MKFCPRCLTEYRDEIHVCADCNGSLVDEATMQKILHKKELAASEVFVKVAVLENQFEADIIQNALKKEKIPVIVRSFHDTAYDGIYIPQKGWGILLVPQEFKEPAEEIILNLRETLTNSTDEQFDPSE